MRVTALELGPFAARCVVVAGDAPGTGLVIDPGFEPEAVLEELDRQGVTPHAVVLTHAHLDHAWGVSAITGAFPAAGVLLHRDDLPLYHNLPMQAQMFGFPAPKPVEPTGFMADGDRLSVGRETLLVRHTPGHSPGHVVLVREDPADPIAIVGDVLFAGSVGRTDLWGGDFRLLERSIREVLYKLPGNTRVVCGHGPDTTIGEEMASNPFVTAYS
ncbi:MAG: MBL fold metallo-hydrolase [Acidobacteriota bacterium]